MSQKAMHYSGCGVDAIVGVSKWARSVRAEIIRVARHDSSVLITGPSGTGKELVARAICTHGSRRNALLVPVDCAALPGELFASQLLIIRTQKGRVYGRSLFDTGRVSRRRRRDDFPR